MGDQIFTKCLISSPQKTNTKAKKKKKKFGNDLPPCTQVEQHPDTVSPQVTQYEGPNDECSIPLNRAGRSYIKPRGNDQTNIKSVTFHENAGLDS